MITIQVEKIRDCWYASVDDDGKRIQCRAALSPMAAVILAMHVISKREERPA